jgi:predicted pyridoxine 5'-phosphate oxidase superfamily flavin-nucleotide-binding protein
MTAQHITTLEALRQLYGPARERSLKKEIPALDAHAVQFIGLSPFVVLASMAEMMRDQIRTFKGEEIEAETQAQTLERYQQSL